MSKKALLKKLLKGIETGSPEAAAVVNEEKYIQHNPQTQEGSEGLAVLFARISKTDPRVTFVRVFEDGDYAFAHNQYDFAETKVAFEVFRFESGQAVEHWDNIQPMQGPNLSGRGMLDGEVAVTDIEKTEENRSFARLLIEQTCIQRQLDRLGEFFADDFIQHNPQIGDGSLPLRAALEAQENGQFEICYQQVHKVLAEGNFVLTMSEGQRRGVHTSYYDLFRIADRKVVEHWNTVEAIAPRNEWKNTNGKF